jgi:ferredoxin
LNKVKLTINNQTVYHPMEVDVLSIARKHFIGIPYACCGGGCGLCKIKVLSGNYEIGIASKTALTDDERKEGYSLACKTYPKSDLVIEIVRN